MGFLASKIGSGGWIRTNGLRVMSPTLSVPMSHFTFKLERLCQLPKTPFEAIIPTGDNPLQSVG